MPGATKTARKIRATATANDFLMFFISIKIPQYN
jgi:hypothetical protein